MTKVSIILPCRNEEKTIAICIRKIKAGMQKINMSEYEIIVSDSSVDDSPDIAKRSGAKVVKHDKEGYGYALLEGFKIAKGDYLIMADADDTYDFLDIDRFIKELDKGYDLVIGSRFKGKIKDGAMPWLHKYIGNPMLSLILSLLFGKKISDSHSGFRAIKRDSFEKLDLKTKGMEFASEMIIKAIKKNIKIKEIPIIYHKRIGESKLESFNDGWKHLRFMLLYSPNFLFLIPGLLFFIFGIIILFVFTLGPARLLGINFDIHPSLLGSLFSIMGYQILMLWLFTKTFLYTTLDEKSKFLTKFYKILNLEKTLMVGLFIFLMGLIINLYILYFWLITDLGELNTLRFAILASTIIILGIQTIFGGFFISILGIKK